MSVRVLQVDDPRISFRRQNSIVKSGKLAGDYGEDQAEDEQDPSAQDANPVCVVPQWVSASLALCIFGQLGVLIRFFLGWGTKEKLFAQVSRRFGFELKPLVMSHGYCAIDVDNERTFEVTEKLLVKRLATA